MTDNDKKKLISQISMELWGTGFATAGKCEKAAAKLVDKKFCNQIEWIDVNERLPDKCQKCLVYGTVYFVPDHVDDCDHYDTISIAEYHPDYGFFKNGVKAWMPLPEMPKMKGGESDA